MTPTLIKGLLALTATLATANATLVDLRGDVDASGFINDALFAVDNSQPAGTGIFGREDGGVFLRIRMTGQEEGYNTNTNGVMDNIDGTWTHDVLFSSLNTVNINDVLYVPFLLDVNENVPQGEITLEALQLFSSTTGGLSHQSLADLAGDSATTLLYDLDGAGDSSVLLDYNLQGTGSGRSDMGMFIPLDLFDGVEDDDFIILYSEFTGSDAGFEEWTLGSGDGGPPPPDDEIPEPSSSALLLISLAALLSRRRR
ncbi:PEP-CTERM protein-sorting domain-containing protein/MYXO-CTERM domain-containing protein [Rubritalea squalenifaciens DSM 18772]|uniref:PEP-CTERM protein-sorting domain-containing protein/MYXO-CTERM domain-containing protein n=1 Tax=Rubritalea squalenifaciens DSM 18772 TaxID=1123071 RepID=A0A1M6JD55_9BACT|nr:PEP-CTERM sorting domain-containing protein [Rubritalea squalenifaciens]SHJ44649.1 PEP-CTERM protein-sorting domain-containing protein/MYXO-CTERM domain-containing protein [Rubritalea squalenifaciens DSM 18772]